MTRIQRRRTPGWRMPPNAVYVGRPTRWGNPWRVDDDLGRALLWDAATVVELYRVDLRTKVPLGFDLAAFLQPLRGHDLVCWCRTCPAHADGLPLGTVCPDCAPCHADVLLALANLPPVTDATEEDR